MSDMAALLLFYCVGVLMLTAEIFIPSHGVLTLAGLGFLVAAIMKTFSYGGREAGIVAIVACTVFLPTFAYVAIKYWRKTPIGRRMAPPNPVLTSADTTVPLELLGNLVGRTGMSKTALRPVGICEFDGKRISCVAELGVIDAGTAVRGLRIAGSNLAVEEAKS